MKKQIFALALASSMLISNLTGVVYSSSGNFETKVLIEPRYKGALPFSEGLAPVKVGEKWGYIDIDGNKVIEPRFDRAGSFSEGKAIVGILKGEQVSGTKGFEIGFIDKEGNYKPFRENGKEFFEYETYVYDEDNFRSLVFHNGMVHESSYNSFMADSDGNVLFKDSNNVPKFRPLGPYNNGLIPAECSQTGDSVFIDKQGNIKIRVENYNESPVFLRASFNQGLAPASVSPDGSWERLWGFIDETGRFKIEPKYKNFMIRGNSGTQEVFSSGIAIVQDADTELWGGIDRNGNTVIDFKFERLLPFSEGLAAAKLPNSDYFGFINTDGDQVIKSYDQVNTSEATRINLVSIFFNGIAVAHDSTTDKTFAIKQTPNEGREHTYDIRGAANLSKGTYFLGETGVLSPGRYMVTNQDGKYGFVENIVTLPLPTRDLMDGWAYDEVVKSINANLVPNSLQNQYREDTIRGDFATIIVRCIEEIRGQDIDDIVVASTGHNIDYHVSKYPFIDTVNRDIVAANALGIIRGVGNDMFDSYSNISRQDAATLLTRAAKFLDSDLEITSTSKFSDQGNIADYAREGVDFVSSLEIMKGTGNNEFSPRSSYTRQQAYITVYRLLQNSLQ